MRTWKGWWFNMERTLDILAISVVVAAIIAVLGVVAYFAVTMPEFGAFVLACFCVVVLVWAAYRVNTMQCRYD